MTMLMMIDNDDTYFEIFDCHNDCHRSAESSAARPASRKRL